MKVLVTGSCGGIGKAAASLFLEKGHCVYGIDTVSFSPFPDCSNYRHFCADITDVSSLPSLDGVEILINCAGVQDSADDIAVNLKGTINVTEKYAFNKDIKSVLIIASASAHTGAEFPLYSASKGGLLSYTRNVAIRLAPYGATCNSLSPGGVITDLNKPVMEDRVLWEKIMELTPLKKWATAEEIAQWCYFLTVINRSCSGEDFLVDNGEAHLNAIFVWPEK
ncbi:MAG: SDR family oxidoreductase [Sphaerochaetaceae bacterium]|nr:SDR family oxidoreductase [Sphaerochaetaceae bacterium]